MQIYWHGFTSVRIEATHGDKQSTLVTDPYESNRGLRFPRTLSPDIVCLSKQAPKEFNLEPLQNSPFVISTPGEFEVQGIFVYAIPAEIKDENDRGKILYRFEAEDISVGFIGDMQRVLTEGEVEQLGNIDILLLPVGGTALASDRAGGGDYLTAKQAAEIISLVEPRMVIPLAHHVSGIKEKLGTADSFCKELVCQRSDANKLKIKKKDLPADELTVTVLERA
jgi:L-ascorbate metabolism protein UlaG (beta-lactamase superfamily)